MKDPSWMEGPPDPKEIRYVVTGDIEFEVYGQDEWDARETAMRILDGIGASVDVYKGLEVHEAWTGQEE